MPLSTLTFGCRLNAAESAAMVLRAREAGLEDAILVNTCAVTAEAVRQARQAIRKARRENPGKTIVVSGCAAQTEPETFARMPEVDLVLGNEEKLHAESYWRVAGDPSTKPNPDVVMPGLDPGIHSVTADRERNRSGMDRRVKPGDDDSRWRVLRPPHAEVFYSAPSRLFHPPHGEVRAERASNHGGEKAPQDEGGMEPRSTQRDLSGPSSTVLRGNADAVGVAPQDEGHQSRFPLPDFGIGASEKIIVGDIFSVRETASHFADGFAAPSRLFHPPHGEVRSPELVEGRASNHGGEKAPQDEGSDRARAFVQVQNGCDHRCTFCIIPYGRGNSRSVPMGAVVDAVRRLVARGVPEIVLTGVDITAYGADLPGRPKLGRLVRAILKHVPNLPRLRLSSIDSVEADPELLRAIAEEERLMPHLHLSLQSGDDMILKRMKRRHSRADAIRFSEAVRRLRPDIVLGADLIAGFPTETDAMFENTLSLVDACGLTLLHVFPFSPRPGTPAARMPQTAPDVVRSRAQTVRQQGHSALMTRLSDEIGTIREVLVETPEFGRTENYLPVTFDTADPGRVVSVRISASNDKSLSGHVIRAAA